MSKFEATTAALVSLIEEKLPGIDMPTSGTHLRRVVRGHMGLVDFLSKFNAGHYAASMESGFDQFEDELNYLAFLEAEMDIAPQYDAGGRRVYDVILLRLMQSEMSV